jgi:hypothetical protein
MSRRKFVMLEARFPHAEPVGRNCRPSTLQSGCAEPYALRSMV